MKHLGLRRRRAYSEDWGRIARPGNGCEIRVRVGIVIRIWEWANGLEIVTGNDVLLKLILIRVTHEVDEILVVGGRG